MYSRWYTISVVLLWLATMTWLVWKKVLPTLLVGEPPDYRTILQSREEGAAECWHIRWNDQPVGWSASRLQRSAQGVTEVHSRVHFERLPLDKMVPKNLQFLVGSVEGYQLLLDVRSQFIFDPLGGLSWFEVRLNVSGVEDVVKARGQITGGQLHVTVHAGEVTYDHDVPLPGRTMVRDALSPDARMPGLRKGQSWTVEIYSPFRPPTEPLELVHAMVERSELIEWNGRMVEALLVVFRSDPGSTARESRLVRGRMWVDSEGLVLRQEVNAFGGTLSFVRMPDDQARRLADRLDW